MAALLFVSSHAQAHAEALYIIVAAQNPLTAISKASLKKIYKLKQDSWFGKGTIYPVNMRQGDALRADFSKLILNKSAAQMEIYYLKMALIGRGQPPYAVHSYDEMIAYVRKHEGAIGYVRQAKHVDGIKVLPIQ